jgi:tetratricopeptide (TPR) repeat protein
MTRPAMKQHLLCFIASLGICLFGLNAAADAQQIKADTGGIAIGGSVTGSTVIIGIPQEKVDELVRDAKRPLEELTTQQKENIALLKEKLDLNVSQVRAALGILGENDIPPERLAAKLVEIAERFRNLQATASAQPGDDPKIATLKADAQKAIDAGELTKADALLADVETEQRRSLDRLALNAAETSAQRGEIALTRLRYAEAATHFFNAAAVFPPKSDHEDKRISYLEKEENALYQQGDELGDNGALLSAIQRQKSLLDMTAREREALKWANAQNNLGLALETLGERESDTIRLQEAAAAFREARKEWTRERVPLDWAMSQNNLGIALSSLGERENGTAKLEEAVVAFREALKEWTREREPLKWAMTQNNLGVTLLRFGQRESGTAKLEEAVVAFREALKERTQERVPLDWAMSQNNLGAALSALGERESGTAKLEEAVVAFREALKEWTRERVPLKWAMSQNSLGATLSRLGQRGSGTAKLEEAVVAFREALKEQTRERVPLDWALSQNNLGTSLTLLGQHDEAVAAYREALKETTRDRMPLLWAMIQNNVGTGLVFLGERERGTAKLEEAAAAFGEALKERTRQSAPLDWARSLGAQGLVMAIIAERRGDARIAKRALDQINTAFETMRDGGHAQLAATFEQALPKARDLVARLGKSRSAR